jgi:hypothetical protein
LAPSTLGFSTAAHGNQSWRIQNVRSGDLRRNRLSIKNLTVIVCAGDKLESVPRRQATIAFQYSFRNKVQTFIVLAKLQRNRPTQNGLGLGLVIGVSFFWGSPDNHCNTFTTWVQFPSASEFQRAAFTAADASSTSGEVLDMCNPPGKEMTSPSGFFHMTTSSFNACSTTP